MRFETVAWTLLAAFAFACSPQRDEPAASASESRSASAEDPLASVSADAPAKRTRSERPLPAFSGWTLENERIAISSFIGKRLLLFFFNPEVRDAATATKSVNAVAGLRGKHNFEIIGVAVGSDRATAKRFASDAEIDFPVIDDSAGVITRQLLLRQPVALLAADAEGYITFGITHVPSEDPNAEEAIEAQIREALRLPVLEASAEPVLGSRPTAPPFRAETMESDEPFILAKQRGRPLALIFFLHTCPHCHEALRFLKKTLAELPEDTRPLLAGIELTGRTSAVRRELRKHDLDFFPVLFDPDSSIRSAYGMFGGVPDIVLIDAEGRIVARVRGWREDLDPPMMRMRLAKLASASVPMLLRTKGYSGSEVCGICHELEHETWQLTSHATAFDTLVEHGADANAECVGCHVVGWNEAGGYESSSEDADLEDVGCESCHGRGGPHLSPGFVKQGNYEPTCLTCHDAKHSLGFQYATFRPRISHAGNAELAKLPLEEKRKLLLARARPRDDLLPGTASHVGSEACRTCHEAEYATWAANPHAGAVRTLAQASEAQNADCLRCHTTGYGKSGGFPERAHVEEHPDLARVGCESCHGPGGDHVADGARKIGTIVSLGDKCDSCVILQICGGCHDEANDPGFEFEVLDKIERLRHGTIEPGTGKPKGRTAQASPSSKPDVGRMLAGAFAVLDERR